jgi:hypothetical protein
MPTGVYPRKPISEETREKLKIAATGRPGTMKGKHHTDDSKKKIGLASIGNKYNLGKKQSLETIEKRVSKLRGRKKKPHTEETKKKISESKLKSPLTPRGKNNHFFINGNFIDLYSNDWNELLKDSIRKRDKCVCQLCGIHQDELDISLHVHHIDYNKDNLNPDNLISLCNSCHAKTNTNREYWIEYFTQTL